MKAYIQTREQLESLLLSNEGWNIKQLIIG